MIQTGALLAADRWTQNCILTTTIRLKALSLES